MEGHCTTTGPKDNDPLKWSMFLAITFDSQLEYVNLSHKYIYRHSRKYIAARGYICSLVPMPSHTSVCCLQYY